MVNPAGNSTVLAIAADVTASPSSSSPFAKNCVPVPMKDTPSSTVALPLAMYEASAISLVNFIASNVVIATITSDADEYAEEVAQQMENAGLRTEMDLRNEKINYKVREHSLMKTPVLIALGKREVEEGTVSIRRLGQKGQKVVSLAESIRALSEESRSHTLST